MNRLREKLVEPEAETARRALGLLYGLQSPKWQVSYAFSPHRGAQLSRKLTSPLVIEELGEGVTVIAGDKRGG